MADIRQKVMKSIEHGHVLRSSMQFSLRCKIVRLCKTKAKILDPTSVGGSGEQMIK